MDPVFRNVEDESLYFRHTQVTKYTHIYSISLQMQMSTSANVPLYLEPVMQIMEDADFHITHVSGSVTSPTDVNGGRAIDASSPLTLAFPMAGSNNRNDRGILFKFIEPKTNRRLTEGRVTTNSTDLAALVAAGSQIDRTFLGFSDVFSPGYGNRLGRLMPFEYYLGRSERLKVRLQITGQAGQGNLSYVPYDRISIAFIGHRYAV